MTNEQLIAAIRGGSASKSMHRAYWRKVLARRRKSDVCDQGHLACALQIAGPCAEVSAAAAEETD